MSGFSRRLKTVAILSALLIVGAGALLVNDGTRADAAKNVTVQAGGGSGGVAVELYRPESVVVNVGDTLTVTNDFEEPHTLSFIVNPADLAPGAAGLTTPVGTGANFNGSATISSGLIEKDATYNVTFATGGAFHFICLLHPGMALDVTVVGSGIFTPPVDTAAAAATLKAGIAAGEAASAALVTPGASKNANGSSTWTVDTGPSVPFHAASVDVMRFQPAKINIAVGDTVTWSNTTAVPHTITFFPTSGPPPADIDPFTNTKNTATFSGKYTNALISASPQFGGVQTFSQTFTTAGTFSYICLLHSDLGMAGVITVGTAASSGAGAITPPNTGDAGLLGQSSSAWMIYAGVALLFASFVAAGGVAFVRRD